MDDWLYGLDGQEIKNTWINREGKKYIVQKKLHFCWGEKDSGSTYSLRQFNFYTKNCRVYIFSRTAVRFFIL